jgi:hypothetical protein
MFLSGKEAAKLAREMLRQGNSAQAEMREK